MTTSKSFRAILPCLSDEEVRRLQAWSAENCAAATVFRESGFVVWLASKERARSREAFLRSVRGVLKRLAINVTRLRGRWLVLAEDSVVRAEAARRATAQPMPPAPTTKILEAWIASCRGASKTPSTCAIVTLIKQLLCLKIHKFDEV